MGLCWLGALRGLWGFCARVELGGLKDCGVFAFAFLSLSLFLSFCPCLFVLAVLCLSSCLVLFVLVSLWLFVVVSFSLSVVQILVTLSKNSLAVYLAFSSSSGWYAHIMQEESDGLPVFTSILLGIISI